ncbi:uncharacterized protein CLUP02_04054 [Colletotrichum lupini]|uniref:Uncharacterized protein n=1 Tax=Colletotrichum lupini TaxID=145971 RepID=A0A9Q8WDB6_9PEZI|nr:uncharacterized protein CLUP02_04054 [Colletotrichum lupini]UQC78577.1 hypothetical protein CLUP02_04054 [Colletotrichum lupini]
MFAGHRVRTKVVIPQLAQYGYSVLHCSANSTMLRVGHGVCVFRTHTSHFWPGATIIPEISGEWKVRPALVSYTFLCCTFLCCTFLCCTFLCYTLFPILAASALSFPFSAPSFLSWYTFAQAAFREIFWGKRLGDGRQVQKYKVHACALVIRRNRQALRPLVNRRYRFVDLLLTFQSSFLQTRMITINPSYLASSTSPIRLKIYVNRSCFVRILDRVDKQSQHAGPAIEKEHSLGEAVHWASDLHVMFGSSTGQKQYLGSQAAAVEVSTGKQARVSLPPPVESAGVVIPSPAPRLATYAATLPPASNTILRLCPSLGFLQQSEFRSISFPIHGSLTSFQKITTYPSLAAALSAWRGVATCYSEYTPP